MAYISDLVGRGKTTLALEYAHRYRRDFESVHWLPCQQRTLVQIAGELIFQLDLKLEGDLDAIVRELNGHCARKRSLRVWTTSRTTLRPGCSPEVAPRCSSLRA